MTPESPVFGILGELAASRFPFAVVVDADGAPKGVLSALDLYDALEQHGPGSLSDLNVLDATQSSALTLRQDTRMSSVVRLFLQTSPDCILAVDESGRLSGVVTQRELLSHVLG
jgi:CBS domain-containing protein